LNHGLPHSQIPLASEHVGAENTLQGGVNPVDEKALSGLQARMERLKGIMSLPFLDFEYIIFNAGEYIYIY